MGRDAFFSSSTSMFIKLIIVNDIYLLKTLLSITCKSHSLLLFLISWQAATTNVKTNS